MTFQSVFSLNVIQANYLRAGEIKIICATTTLAMGINLPFKNVILSGDKYVSDNGDYKRSYRTSLSLADVENKGGYGLILVLFCHIIRT